MQRNIMYENQKMASLSIVVEPAVGHMTQKETLRSCDSTSLCTRQWWNPMQHITLARKTITSQWKCSNLNLFCIVFLPWKGPLNLKPAGKTHMQLKWVAEKVQETRLWVSFQAQIDLKCYNGTKRSTVSLFHSLTHRSPNLSAITLSDCDMNFNLLHLSIQFLISSRRQPFSPKPIVPIQLVHYFTWQSLHHISYNTSCLSHPPAALSFHLISTLLSEPFLSISQPRLPLY